MNYRTSIHDAMELAAKKVAVEGWQGYVWEAMEGWHLITGEVPDGVYTRGPKKGKPRFRSPGSQHKKKVVVSDTELQQAAAAYEAETGKCWDCKGSGQEWASWSAAEGTKYRTCKRCGGDGKAHNASFRRDQRLHGSGEA